MMTSTSLTTRVTTRVPFQTLAPAIPDVENGVVHAPPSDEEDALELSEATQQAMAHAWFSTATIFLIAENIVRILQPLAIGLAIDGLLVHSYQGLVLLGGQQLAFLFLYRMRQMSIARQLNRLVTDDAQHITSGRHFVCDSTQMPEEGQRLHEQIEQLRHRLPQTIHIAATLCGAILLLAWHDWLLVPLCLSLVPPTILLNMAFSRKSQLFSRELVQREQETTRILSAGDPKLVYLHFDRLKGKRLQIATAETASFSLMQLFVLGLMMTSLIHYCLGTSAEPGAIIAVVLYLLLYTTALTELPTMLRNIASLSGR